MRRELLIEKYIPPTRKIRTNIYITEIWENKKGELHSFNDQPAFFQYYISKMPICKVWYKNGKQHRNKNKPSYDSFVLRLLRWYKNGEIIKEKYY